MKIRIAYVIDAVMHDRAGTEQQLLSLINALDKERFEPHILCLRPSPFLETIDICPTAVFDARSFKHPSIVTALSKLVRYLKEHEIDIVQTHFRDGNIFGVIGGKLAGTRSIVSARRGQLYWDTPMGRRFTLLLNALTTDYFTNSVRLKGIIEKEERVATDDITVFANAFDMDKFQTAFGMTKAQCREKIGLTEEDFGVGIVANCRPIKRHDVFLNAAAKASEKIPHARFFIVGDDSDAAALKQQAADLGIADRVTFTGSRTDVPEIVKALDVAMLTSDYESLSNSILEYVLLGVPVVCTRVGDNEVYITEGQNGYLAKPGDSEALAAGLVSVANGYVSADEVSLKAAHVKQLCTKETIMQRYEEAYRRLVETNGGFHSPR